jgi:hypothetical protein
MDSQKRGSAMRQTALPFREGEASHAERWNDLVIALYRTGPRCNCELATFVRWVFNATSGGTSGVLIKSYEELAARPLGLCCSRRTAARTVERAVRLRLVAAAHRLKPDGTQMNNAYTIDWEGVRMRKLGREPSADLTMGVAEFTTPIVKSARALRNTVLAAVERSSDTGPVGTDPTPGDFNEETLESGNDACAPGAQRAGAGVDTRIRMPGAQRAGPDDGRAPGAHAAGAAIRAPGAHAAGADADQERILAQSPILATARGRRIAPLPANTLVHGVFAGIAERHLQEPFRLVEWHRRQLDTAVCVQGDTEADLLLTLATAMYAAALPEGAVRRNRVAVFVHTISRRKWLRALPYVPQAKALLDQAIARLGAEWAGLEDES